MKDSCFSDCEIKYFTAFMLECAGSNSVGPRSLGSGASIHVKIPLKLTESWTACRNVIVFVPLKHTCASELTVLGTVK